MSDIRGRKFYRSLAPMARPSALAAAFGGWAGVFGRQAPLDLEIGFGNGERLHRQSLAEPGRDLVGVELAWNSVKRALRRLAAPPRPNVRLLWLPAEPALRLLFAPESLSRVVCLFPVPWPNERQSRKRLFSRPFLDLLANRLAPDGTLHLVTDHEGLARWIMAEAEGSAMELSLSGSPAAMGTKYERKWLSGGQNAFHHIRGAKKAHPPGPPPGTPDMPPRYSSSINPLDYRPEGRSGAPAVVFGELVYDEPKGEGLLQAKVVEDQFVQEFHIRLTRLADGRFKVAPALPAQILPTAAVALALDLAASPGRPPAGPPAASGDEAAL
jgi:tRNA (guanine-N7-)-methyltransferase